MKIDKKLIKELKDYLDEFNLSEIEYQDGNKKVKVAKNISAPISVTAHKANTTPVKEESGTKVTSPIIGTAQRPSMPPRNIITTKFFFLDVKAKAGRLNPAKNNVVAEPFKKSLLDIFMLSIPQVD